MTLVRITCLVYALSHKNVLEYAFMGRHFRFHHLAGTQSNLSNMCCLTQNYQVMQLPNVVVYSYIIS